MEDDPPNPYNAPEWARHRVVRGGMDSVHPRGGYGYTKPLKVEARHLNMKIEEIHGIGTEEDQRRGWPTGHNKVPAVIRGLLATPNWRKTFAPDLGGWSTTKHSQTIGRIARGPKRTNTRIREDWVRRFFNYLEADSLTRGWLYSSLAFRAPKYLPEPLASANSLFLDPVEIANLSPPPDLHEDPDFLAIQGFCSGLRGKYRHELMVDLTTESMLRGLGKIANHICVRVAIASPWVRYLNGVRIKEGFLENTRAVEKTMRRPMGMTKAEREAWSSAPILGAAVAEAVGSRSSSAKGRRARHTPKARAWMSGWRYRDRSLVLGERPRAKKEG